MTNATSDVEGIPRHVASKLLSHMQPAALPPGHMQFMSVIFAPADGNSPRFWSSSVCPAGHAIHVGIVLKKYMAVHVLHALQGHSLHHATMSAA